MIADIMVIGRQLDDFFGTLLRNCLKSCNYQLHLGLTRLTDEYLLPGQIESVRGIFAVRLKVEHILVKSPNSKNHNI